MEGSGARRRALAAASVSGVGLLGVLVSLWHVLEEGGMMAVVFGVVLPMALSVGLVVAGVWLYRSDLDDEDLPRVVLGMVGGVLALAVVVGATLAYQRVEGGVVVDAPFVATNYLTTGAIGGALLGVYDARQRQRRRELAASERRHRTLVETLPDALVVADAETGAIVDVNTAAERLFGRTRAALLDCTQTDLHPRRKRRPTGRCSNGTSPPTTPCSPASRTGATSTR